MVFLLVLLAGQMTSAHLPSYEVSGLPGSSLTPREADYDSLGNMVYDFAVFLDGERLSPWTPYPLFFNPAKTYSVYSGEDGTLEITSQLPYSAEYTYASYAVDDGWNLTLLDFGNGDYYESMTTEIESLISEGDFQEACFRSMEIMYPGAMPGAEYLCSRLVVAASEEGTLEAFNLAREVSLNLLGLELYEIENDSYDFTGALKSYADLCDTETSELVMERIRNNE